MKKMLPYLILALLVLTCLIALLTSTASCTLVAIPLIIILAILKIKYNQHGD